MAPPIDRSVLFEVFECGLDDRISLSEVGGSLSRLAAIPDETLCVEMRRCVHALVDEGWFRPGTLDAAGQFNPLSRPLDEVLSDVCEQWTGWDDLTWWFVVWLELTEEGRAAAVQRFPELKEPN